MIILFKNKIYIHYINEKKKYLRTYVLNEDELTFRAYLKIILINSIFYKNEINTFLIVFIFAGLSNIPVLSWSTSFQLFTIITINKSIHNMIKAIYMRGIQLSIVFLAQILLSFIFAILGFYYINTEFKYNSNDMEITNGTIQTYFCETLIQCFLMSIDYGVRPDGGIGDILDAEAYYSKFYTFRFLYDLIYFFFIKIILTNILFGIIIDTFHELKEIEARDDDDKKNVCYLCGLRRHHLEKNGKNFDFHCSKEHNIWNYLYFFFYLRNLQKEDMNGLESYIYDLVEKNEIGFFPQGKFISNTGN